MFNQNDYPRAYVAGYRLTALLSQSATSQVFLANSASASGQQVIIKRLSAISLITERERERFLLEVAFLQQLQHRGILTIIAAGIDKYTPYMIVPYASDGTLYGQLRRRAPMTFTKEEALPILQQVGQALHYAHQRNIIHSNLKPNNILFQSNGQAQLADFAFTSLPTPPTHLDINALGSSAYQAPEQPLGEFSKAGDQYALGCIAYEMLTGYRPFTFSSVNTNKYYREGEEEGLISPRQLNPKITEQIEQAILTAMRQDPAFRYSSIQEFLVGLGPSGVSTRSRKISLHAISEQDVTASLPAISRPPRTTRQESAVLATVRKADLKLESAVLTTVRDLKQESAVLATVKDLKLVSPETPLPMSGSRTRANEEPHLLIEITGQFRVASPLATRKLALVTENSTPLPAIWRTPEKRERVKPEETSTTVIIPRPIRSPYPPYPTGNTVISRQRRRKRYYLLRGMAGAAAVVGIASMFVITLIHHQPDAHSKQTSIGQNTKKPTVTSGKVDTWKAPGAFQNPSNEPIAEGEPGLVPTRGVVGPIPPIVLAPTSTPTETATPQPGGDTPEPSNPQKSENTQQPEPSNPSNPHNPGYPSNPSNPNNSSNPSNPSNPHNPGYPNNPHNPSNPNNPSNPGYPSNPHNPNYPSNPRNPNYPSNPGYPNNPHNPSNPPQWGSGSNRGGINRPHR